jgi:hypothetical protein
LSLLFYNNNSGVSRLYSVDDQGQLIQVNKMLSLGSNWTHIVPCSIYTQQYPYNTQLLCYNKNSGAAKFFGLDSADNLIQLSNTTYSTGWTHILHGFFKEASGNESLLFYNSSSGLAQFYSTDGQGGINQLSSSTYSTGWTHIISGIFVAGYTNTALLFYNSSSGLAQFYSTDGQGGINQLSSSTYSKGWSEIVDFPGLPSNMPDTGNPDRLLFYNSGSGLAQVYNTDNKGGISQLSNSNVNSGWLQVEWLANS